MRSTLAAATLILLTAGFSLAQMQRVDAPRAAMLAETVAGLMILDLRTPGEFSSGSLNDAVNIDYYGSNFKAQIAELPRETPYLIYCRSGRRSGGTLEFMRSEGFKEVYHLEGGVLAWRRAGLPLHRPLNSP